MEALHLQNGDSKRTVCPFCNATHELSFRIRRDDQGQTSGYCYRNSCNKSVYAGRQSQGKATKKAFTPRTYKGTTSYLSELQKYMFLEKYNIQTSTLKHEKVYWSEEDMRFIFPVYDKFGNTFGSIAKAKDATKTPKWLTYFHSNTHRLHYPKGFHLRGNWFGVNRTLHVTEDIISAWRINQMDEANPAIALLGTHMTAEQASELAVVTPKLTLVLDPDAIDAAIKIKNNYNALFTNGINIRYMEVDPKDYDSDRKLLNDLIN